MIFFACGTLKIKAPSQTPPNPENKFVMIAIVVSESLIYNSPCYLLPYSTAIFSLISGVTSTRFHFYSYAFIFFYPQITGTSYVILKNFLFFGPFFPGFCFHRTPSYGRFKPCYKTIG